MNVYEIIETANQMRPGNNYSDELVERWIAECDASIQIEVCRKKPNTIRRIRADEWKSKVLYLKGQKASIQYDGKWHQFEAVKDVSGETYPHEDSENWMEIPYDTYLVHPHDRLYVLYVIAMMDYANMEYDNYANDRVLYESAVDEFARWWQRTYSYGYVEGVDEYEADVRHP